jgi:hypothetical protein
MEISHSEVFVGCEVGQVKRSDDVIPLINRDCLFAWDSESREIHLHHLVVSGNVGLVVHVFAPRTKEGSIISIKREDAPDNQKARTNAHHQAASILEGMGIVCRLVVPIQEGKVDANDLPDEGVVEGDGLTLPLRYQCQGGLSTCHGKRCDGNFARPRCRGIDNRSGVVLWRFLGSTHQRAKSPKLGIIRPKSTQNSTKRRTGMSKSMVSSRL